MIPLPEGYFRIPVVGWVGASVRSHPQNGKPATIVYNTGALKVEGDDFTVVEHDTICGANVAPAIQIIPAQPDSFEILHEEKNGSLEHFCYEVGGVFTDLNFDELMRKKGR